METEFEAPPMSGGNLPLKELTENKPPEQLLKKKRSKLLVIVIVLAIFFSIILGIMIGLLLKKEKQSAKRKSLSPSPSYFLKEAEQTPPPSFLKDKDTLSEKINSLKENLENLDLKESALTPPLLDYKIRFK